MKALVLGAGVIGVSSAWFLARAGFEVVVLERQAECALETSFANAGMLSYGYCTPWAAPNVPFKAMKWLMKKHSPLIIRPDGSVFQWQWLWQMWRNCALEVYVRNKARLVQLSEYSRAQMQALEQALPLAFEGRKQGTLQVFRSQAEVLAAQDDVRVLQEAGVACQVIETHQQCLAYEPALVNARATLVGGLHMPDDATGDCRLFTLQLAEKCREIGVEFVFESEIERIEVNNQAVSAVIAGGKRFQADEYVCALGCFSRALLADIGIHAPIYPVKGYSLTLDITDEGKAPVSTVMDDKYKVAITRFDKRVRVGGMAEFSGYGLQLPPARRKTLEMVVESLFPGCGALSAARFWSGLRPMTPDSVPMIGRTRLRNLSINSGHGTLGWTLAAGSAKLLADCVAGNPTEIPATDYAPTA